MGKKIKDKDILARLKTGIKQTENRIYRKFLDDLDIDPNHYYIGDFERRDKFDRKFAKYAKIAYDYLAADCKRTRKNILPYGYHLEQLGDTAYELTEFQILNFMHINGMGNPYLSEEAAELIKKKHLPLFIHPKTKEEHPLALFVVTEKLERRMAAHVGNPAQVTLRRKIAAMSNNPAGVDDNGQRMSAVWRLCKDSSNKYIYAYGYWPSAYKLAGHKFFVRNIFVYNQHFKDLVQRRKRGGF